MNYKTLFKNKRGVIGLEVLLSIVAMLFVIGILVMAFTIAGSKLEDIIDDTDAETIINTTKTSLGDVVDWFGTYIVMASIVVIILLVVIIINAVRGGGLMGGGGA